MLADSLLVQALLPPTIVKVQALLTVPFRSTLSNALVQRPVTSQCLHMQKQSVHILAA
jgi:hypothetical protein